LSPTNGNNSFWYPYCLQPTGIKKLLPVAAGQRDQAAAFANAVVYLRINMGIARAAKKNDTVIKGFNYKAINIEIHIFKIENPSLLLTATQNSARYQIRLTHK
jgi:hypothetical protein